MPIDSKPREGERGLAASSPSILKVAVKGLWLKGVIRVINCFHHLPSRR